MRLGNINDLRLALGTRPDGKPAVSYDYAKALKYAAGCTERIFDIDAVRAWLKEHANFSPSAVNKKRWRKTEAAA